ncbi:unnamed protein product [Moneuplotes crassus]|uniref:Uncharacterized protein n=1 Tax=Euplotes crassus TaxID=5936 RepID=A0AAD1Y268_EUPCR|nr:unnamed protein product [Moneuplotes crassus]
MTDNLINGPEEEIEYFNLGKKYKQFTQKGGVEFLQRFLTSISKQCILNKNFLKNLCEENKSSIKDHGTDPDKVLKRITSIKIKRKGLAKRDISMPKELEFLLKMIKKGRIEFQGKDTFALLQLCKVFVFLNRYLQRSYVK